MQNFVKTNKLYMTRIGFIMIKMHILHYLFSLAGRLATNNIVYSLNYFFIHTMKGITGN